MKSLALTLLIATAGVSCIGCGPDIRVGTYDSRAVACAFYRSGVNNQRLEDLKARLEEAQSAGNAEEAQRLKALPGQWQDLAHKQVFSDAPIPGIIERIADKLPEIQEKSGVDKIVDKRRNWNLLAPRIDVTDAMVDLFNPTDDTRKVISGLVKHPPVWGPIHKH